MNERGIYWAVGAVAAVLLVIMMVTWNYDRTNAVAEQKADDLIAAYDDAGLRTPYDRDAVARVLGDDGGAVCAAAGSDVAKGYLLTRIGVGGEFYFRPTIADEDLLEGLLLIVEVYCPQKLPDVTELKQDLDFANLVRT